MTIGELLTNRTVERFTIGDHGVCSLTISGGYAGKHDEIEWPPACPKKNLI